mmetsp:Transcript_25414/g.60549  ORF Transcript_25414/g.60549 Transcript_25414/m.60549 type:complete len:355 (-) Transcript_25414:124-1188(-)
MGLCCATRAKPVFKSQAAASIFADYDLNGNGELETGELKIFLRDAFPGAGLSDEDMDALSKEFDADNTGTIGINELHAFLRCYDQESQSMIRKTALLVIDVQNDFISGTLAVEGSEAIVPIINTMRDSFDCVVISYDWHPYEHCSFVESANTGVVPLLEMEKLGSLKPFSEVTLRSDADRKEHTQMLYPRHAVKNTEGSKCHSDLVMKPEDMSVFKGVKPNIDSYSAFFDNCKANDTGLTKQLEYAGVTDVYCVGLVFDICVKSSALHGAEMGFRLSVVEDACKPLNQSDVEPTKATLGKAGVRVMSSSEAIEEAKQIKANPKMAVRDYIHHVKVHKRAAALHRSETLSSHRPK